MGFQLPFPQLVPFRRISGSHQQLHIQGTLGAERLQRLLRAGLQNPRSPSACWGRQNGEVSENVEQKDMKQI